MRPIPTHYYCNGHVTTGAFLMVNKVDRKVRRALRQRTAGSSPSGSAKRTVENEFDHPWFLKKEKRKKDIKCDALPIDPSVKPPMTGLIKVKPGIHTITPCPYH